MRGHFTTSCGSTQRNLEKARRERCGRSQSRRKDRRDSTPRTPKRDRSGSRAIVKPKKPHQHDTATTPVRKHPLKDTGEPEFQGFETFGVAECQDAGNKRTTGVGFSPKDDEFGRVVESKKR